MLVIGAKGFAKQLLEVFDQLDKTDNLSFYDDISKDVPSLLFGKFNVIRNVEEAKKYFNTTSPDFALGIGGPAARKTLTEKFNSIGGKLASVVSPHSRISKFNCNLGQGVNILPNCVLESDVTIGVGSLINLNCMITHDTTIGKFCEISPGTLISGGCAIGDLTFIGTGAIILPKIKIGNNVTIAAGAVVTKDVGDNQVVIGVPAKKIQK